jgi:hypothetical protein
MEIIRQIVDTKSLVFEEVVGGPKWYAFEEAAHPVMAVPFKIMTNDGPV